MSSGGGGDEDRRGRCGAAEPPLLVIVGPTAVGKSDCALLVCERFGGEILSVDSMQIYRGLDRGTGKPGPEARRRVRHHGIDLADPGQDFSLGDFVRAAERAIEEIRGRGRLPVLVGGTGLYLRGLLKGIVEAPGRDEAMRARLGSIAARRGAGHLHRLLTRVDPASAGRVQPADGQRIARALEVRFTQRQRLSDMIRASPFGPDRHRSLKIGLTMRRDVLYRLIDERVARFFADGLVEELSALLAAGHPESSNAFKAIGYREALRHLRGEIGLDEAIDRTRRNTRRYAKRQWTWFRKEDGVTWFGIDPAGTDRFAGPLAHFARGLERESAAC